MWNKLKLKWQRFMRTRYGWDNLNTALYVVGFLSLVLSYFYKRNLFLNFSSIIIVIALLRSFSTERGKRRKENTRFMELLSPFKSLWVRFKNRRYYRYVHCPSCNKLAKVPKGKGKVSIHCPYCHFVYERRV